MKQDGGLPQFNDATFLLTVLMVGAVPFALAPFSSEICQVDILPPEQVEQHANLVLATLFPEALPWKAELPA